MLSNTLEQLKVDVEECLHENEDSSYRVTVRELIDLFVCYGFVVPPSAEDVPNPTDRIDPAGRVVYPDLTAYKATAKGYHVSECQSFYGSLKGDIFTIKGNVIQEVCDE